MESQPCSLAIATIEPEKVMAPTNIETEIETSLIKGSKDPAFATSLKGNKKAPIATNREDIPPNPLNKATVSGIDVIGTFLASKVPNKLPTKDPTRIHAHD